MLAGLDLEMEAVEGEAVIALDVDVLEIEE